MLMGFAYLGIFCFLLVFCFLGRGRKEEGLRVFGMLRNDDAAVSVSDYESEHAQLQ